MPQRSTHVALLITVIVVSSTLGIGVAFFFAKQKPAVDTPIISTTELWNPIRSDADIEIKLSTDRSVFLLSLKEGVRDASNRLTRLLILTDTGDVADTENILRVIDPRTSGTFIRSINNMVIGSIKTLQNEPFILLSSNNFDASFAGMIAWEKNISADLAPLFGAPISRSFDTHAQTIDQTIPAQFTDAIVSNKTIRILYDEEGAERIIYAFVNKNTILITTSTEALSALLGEL